MASIVQPCGSSMSAHSACSLNTSPGRLRCSSPNNSRASARFDCCLGDGFIRSVGCVGFGFPTKRLNVRARVSSSARWVGWIVADVGKVATKQPIGLSGLMCGQWRTRGNDHSALSPSFDQDVGRFILGQDLVSFDGFASVVNVPPVVGRGDNRHGLKQPGTFGKRPRPKA